MENQHDLSFDHLDHVLARAGASADPSDSHGFLSGLICAAGQAQPEQWEQQLLAGQESDNAKTLLQAHYRDALTRLNSAELDFEILLPQDEEDLKWRTDMLGQWCLGFLSGMGVGGLPDANSLPEEVSELLEDLTQISRVEFEIDDPGEEDEVAFQEIVEYVRVGVLYLIEELQPLKPSPRQLQ
ncbi:MAG: UPF0149 family protein [Gammaproteobacteria bacterium]